MAQFHITFDHEANEALRDLALKTRATKADVIRDALTTYQYLLGQVRTGQRVFFAADPAKELTEVTFTTMKPAAK